MSIWRHTPPLADLNATAKGTIDEHLGIRFTEIGADFLRARMPVDERTRQPFGLLHGGASVVLAESLGSVAAMLCVDPATHYCVGLDINANHIRAVREGSVTGTASPVHIGSTTQVWQIHLRDDSARLTCIARITMAVLAGPGQLTR